MADTKHFLQFLERGVGVFFDVGLEFVGVKLAPFSPAFFGGQRAFLGSRQIAVDRASPQVKMPGGLYLGAATVKKFDHPFPQVQPISLHAS